LQSVTVLEARRARSDDESVASAGEKMRGLCVDAACQTYTPRKKTNDFSRGAAFSKSSLSQQLFSAAFLSSLSQQPLSSFFQQPFSAVFSSFS